MSSSPFSFDVRNPFIANGFASTPSAFEDATDDGAVSATAAEGSYTYAMVQTTPAVNANEVESKADAVEITVRWGTSILHVAHLSPIRSFVIGEDAACDFVMPANMLGVSRIGIVSLGSDGNAVAVVAPSATACVTKGDSKTNVEGGSIVSLEKGSNVHIELGAFTFDVATVNAGRKIRGGMVTNKRALGASVLAAAVHLGVFAAMFAFTPALNSTDDGSMTADQRTMVSQTLQAMAEKEMKEPEVQATSTEGQTGGNDGGRAEGREGKAGVSTAAQTNKAWANKGQADRPTLTRAEAISEAQTFGMVGILNSGSDSARTDATTAVWAQASEGSDALTARANIWGDSAGESFGEGGLSLSSDGDGGGGRAHGIGLDAIDTAGHGTGTCTGPNCTEWGNSGGILTDPHHPKSPSMRTGKTVGGGRLPPEAIQRTLRQNFGRFRMCYQTGLQTNPGLAGRVVVSFVISTDGSVASTSNGGSNLPDANVIGCVVRSVGGISFPAPDGGIVKVTYPIAFSPAN